MSNNSSLYAYANNNPLKYTDPTGTSYVSFDDWSYSSSSSSNWEAQKRQTWAMEDAYTAQLNSNWERANASYSNSAFGSNGNALTSFNISNNFGGLSYTNVMNTPGAGIPTGTPDFSWMTQTSQPSQPASSNSFNFSDILSHVSGSGGVAAAGQLLFLGANASLGVTRDGSGSSCYYASGCGRVGFGLVAGGGGEVAGKIGRPLENGVDYSVSYYSSKVRMGLFSDSTTKIGQDGLEYSKELVGGGWGPGAVGYQGCATLYFGCD